MATSFKHRFDSLCLAAVVHEAQILVGGRLQKLVQLDEHTLCLGVFSSGEEHWLLISCHPEYARTHLLSGRPEGIKPAPDTCTNFRRRLKNGRVVFVKQRGLDRILEVGIAAADGDYQIAAEMMGRHSNVILVDSNLKIQESLIRVGKTKSSRVVLPGHRYTPPPFEPKPPLTEAGESDDLKGYEGWSPNIAALVDGGLSLDELKRAVSTNSWKPCSSTSAVYPLPFPESEPNGSLSEGLEAFYRDKVQTDQIRQARHGLLGQLKRVQKARKGAISGLEKALDTASRAAELQLKGELILAYQHQIKEGDRVVEVVDYEGNPIQISLNPEMTVLENSQRQFKRAKNAKAGAEGAREQLKRIEHELEIVEDLISRTKAAVDVDEVDRVKETARSHRWLHSQEQGHQKKDDRPYEGHTIRSATSPAGWTILYGMNATSNDYLTNRVAKPNDWWLHVRGATSAHVVIQTHNQPMKVQPEDLRFAAEIAVKNSTMKHATYVPVDYTLKKHVRKPRKAAPGLAVYQGEKVLYLD